MSVRMRHTRGHTGNRRSHHALESLNVVVDKASGNLRLPHRIDEATGMYRGKQVAPAKAVKEPAHKHGPSTAPAAASARSHEHENAEVKAVEHEVKELSEAKDESKAKKAK